MVLFVHTSDWQIGMKGTGLGSAAEIVRKARIQSIRKVFEIARTNNVDFVIISGDTFEHNMVGSEDVNAVISIFNEYREIPKYLLPGNHDHLGPGSLYDRDIFSRVENLTVFKSNIPVSVGDVTLHPIPIYSKFQEQTPVDEFNSVKDAPGIHIGISHGSVVGGFGVTEGLDLPINSECVEKYGLDYLALGHWHNYRLFPDSEGVQRIAYCGTHEQTKYSEHDTGYCLLVEISKKGVPPVINPIKCNTLTWGTIEFKIKDKTSLKELEELLKKQRNVELLQLEITGELDINSKPEFDSLMDYQETEFRDFRLITKNFRYLVPIDLDRISDHSDPTLNQVEIELRKRIENSSDEQRPVLIEALTLLHRLSQEAE
jgi:DNA repair exonuclease SbcCD nuclease subunit